ncbi:hypothetical protein IE53DRAFT_386168 [Violaceomyces palustris]|uniref:Uncharacterized protein n=1 Tax=Violaceomyces palustris TaxID=1673888 RepID=A0ACD0NZY4_9BASI|nr:hypothetical protein IE53DRAFT_386168 [Violaceomyces palustris]
MAYRSSSLLACLLLFTFLPLSVLSQETTTFTTITAQEAPTGSASLNAPTKSAQGDQTTPASSSSSDPSATQTTIPKLDLSGPSVPFLLQRPLSAEDDPRKHKLARPRAQDVFFTGCSDDSSDLVDAELRLNVSAVYAQFDPDLGSSNLTPDDPYSSGVLRISAIGAMTSQAQSANSDLRLLSTLSVQTKFLTFPVFSLNTYVCDQLYPTLPDPDNQLITPAGCLYGAGEVGFGIAVPLNDTYTLGSLWTQIRLSDTSSPPRDIACIEVTVSPYHEEKWYWDLIFWFPVALTVGYFVVTSLARVVTAITARAKSFRSKAREGSAPHIIKDKLSPTIVASLSGQQLVMSPALLRFATPGCWDVITHTQFVALLAMVAVRWSEFSYPFFKQAAWANLVGNVSLVQPESSASTYQPLATNATLPVGDFATQISNRSSPIFMDASKPNVFLNLNGSRDGMEAFAYMLGMRPQDLFGTCLAIWLAIVAALVVVSLLIWLVDTLLDTAYKIRERRENGGAIDLGRDDGRETKAIAELDNEGNMRPTVRKKGGYRFLGRAPAGLRPTRGLHFKVLHGNIVRALILFHLPVTIFSSYQIATSDQHSAVSTVLAGLSLAFISILFPALLLFKLTRFSTAKLYDSIGTLSAYGPLYNTYSPGSQLFCAVDFGRTFILGVVVGAAQKSGTAQAIVILVVEILFALACSLWLPWGDGAMMGPISFLASVCRIISAVLLILLSPLVGFGREPVGWLTYVILLIQAILYVGAALILVVKVVEGLVRLFGKAPFDERSSTRNGGLGGAVRRIRKRKERTLQLPGGRDKVPRADLGRSNSTNTQTLMLANAARPGSAGSPRGPGQAPARIPHSRQASYASYLDSSLYSKRAPAEYLNENGPYSAYFRGDPNDEGFIMAALPPTAPPGWTSNNSTLVSSSGTKQQQQQQPGFETRQSSGGGFVRMGGGKATDSSPYQSINNQTKRDSFARPSSGGSLPGNQEGMQARRSSRPQSHSGISDSFYGDSARLAGHPSSFQALDRSTQMSSTQAARESATQGGAALVPHPSRKRKAKKGFWRRNGVKGGDGDDSSDDDDDDDDDDHEDDGRWDGSSPNARGPWAGITKMGAALRALQGRLGGRTADGDDLTPDASLEPPYESSGGSKGFEVVRAPRPRRSSVGAGQALDSTALAAASAQAQTQVSGNGAKSGEAKFGRGDDEPTDMSRSGSRTGAGKIMSLLAPANASTSTISRTSEDGGEEKFWLPARNNVRGIPAGSAATAEASSSNKDANPDASSSLGRTDGVDTSTAAPSLPPPLVPIPRHPAEPMSAEVLNAADELEMEMADAFQGEEGIAWDASQAYGVRPV